jgi:meiotic recombination protein DMC1
MDMELETREEAVEETLDFDPSLLEEHGVQEIDKLESVGINVSDIKKLKAAGLYTMASIMMATSSYLTAIKGLSEVKVQKIIECVKKVRDAPQKLTCPRHIAFTPPHHTISLSASV